MIAYIYLKDIFHTCMSPFSAQAWALRHLLQSFPTQVTSDQEASIVDSALELQHTTCTSTRNCFSGADCISGICTCRSPYVKSREQVRPVGYLMLWHS